MKRFCAIALSSTFLLASCGSSDSDGGETNTAISTKAFNGKVIDGYIAGATIFLDLNFNSVLDEGEPSTVSAENGDWSLELTEDQQSCISYVPIISDVPVGAIDEELGEVTEAYQMVKSPGFVAINEEEAINITPLTSVVWEYMQSELEGENEELSCETVKANASQQEELLALLESSIEDIVRHYNLSESQIFSDFIANNDADAYNAAQDIVKGLQKSFIETAELKKQYPDADYTKVRYHKFSSIDADDLYPNAWYRDTSVFADGLWITHLEKMNEDLSTPFRTIIYGERTFYKSNDGSLTLTTSFEFESRQGDDSGYMCDIKENIFFEQDETEYELVNLAGGNAEVFEGCVIEDFASQIDGRYLFINYKADDIRYATHMTFFKQDGESEFGFLDNWVNVVEQKNTLQPEDLVIEIEALPYQYDNNTEYTNVVPDLWFKTKTYEENSETISIQKDHNGSYTKIVTHEDRTTTQTCGIDEVNWATCED